MALAVFPIVEVVFNRLRAEFPMQIKPPFGMTDFIGEHATAGFPRVGTDGDIYSGNDSANTDNAQGGVEFDPIARCLTARSLFVLHDNIIDEDGYGVGSPGAEIGEYGNPTVVWSDIVYSTPDYQAVSLNDIPGYTSVRVSLFDPSPNVGVGNFTMIGTPGAAGVGCQGFTARMQYYTVSTPPMEDWEEGYEPYKAAFAMRFRVTGSGRGKIRWYSVSFVMASGIRIGYNDEVDGDGNPDEAFWSYIDEGKAGDAKANNIFPSLETFETSETLTDSGVQLFEVRLIGGQLRIMLGSEDTPYVWPHPQEDDTATPDWLIDRWMAAGEELFLARWSVHLTKWYTTAATISNEINCGFAPSAVQLLDMTRRVHFLSSNPNADQRLDPTDVGFKPPGTNATAENYDVNGTVYRYRLVFTNDEDGTYRGIPYSHYSAAVRAVTIDFKGIEWYLINPPTILGLPGNPSLPEAVDVYHDFDLATLSIRSRSELTFNNFHGVWTNWNNNGVLDANGHFAAAINLGTLAYGGFEGAYRREFTGYMNTSFVDNWNDQGKDKVTVFGKDVTLSLNVPVWNLPWMDGWNVYYAMAYLAGLGGFTLAQMQFAPLVPESPYDLSPGIPLSQQYFLPVGPAGAPLTRYTGGQKLWDIMLKISNSIGFMLFADVFATLRFYKFYVPALTPYTKTFTYLSGRAFDPQSWGTDAIWSGSYSSSLDEVRNSVTVIGVNAFGPLWDPIVAHQYDNDSIFNDFAPNFKGFNDPMVWMDNIFAFPEFANAAALTMLAYLRIPDKAVNLSTWYPSGPAGVYPGDLIQVINPRSGATNYPFFVMSTHSHFGRDGLPRMDIQGRLVPAQLFGF